MEIISPALKVGVTDEVKVADFVMMRRVRARRAVKSPFFQPEFTFVEREMDWYKGKPRGPTIVINFEPLGTFA
jgi:hypothetical protein